MRTKNLACFMYFACGVCVAQPGEGPFTPQAREAAELIDGQALRAIVAELSDDRYGGRAPGSDGDRMARAYLAEMLESIGFAPGAADGGWEQAFDLVAVESAQPGQWAFTGNDATVELEQHEEFIVSSGVQEERAQVTEAELVFVGYGIEAPEYDWDDFKGADLTGKVLLMLNNDPDWDPDLFGGEERLYYGRWTYKYESAARQGAAGAIIIHTTPSAGYPWQVVQTSWTGPQFGLPAGDEPRLQAEAWVTEDAARELAAAAGLDLDALVEQARSRDFEPVPMGLTTSLAFDNTISQTQSANVLGVLEGADPARANEAVIYTAHHDHLGMYVGDDGEPVIYNGARDNASGVAIVLEIGRALAALPERPGRSIVLLFPGAEEQGLLGARHYAANPTFHPGRIAANINYDSANIWGRTRDVASIGLGKSDLDDVARTVVEHQGRVLVPDQFPDRGYYYRSDQFALAAIGVPALWFQNGTEFIGRPEGWGVERINEYNDNDYHQPSDELTDDWNFEGMVEDAELGFWAGLIVAEADELPTWRPGDEFEAARQAAFEDAERQR